MTGSASGSVGRKPIQSRLASRSPSAVATSSLSSHFVYPSSCPNRSSTGGAHVPPSSTSPADLTPPDIGVTMNPPSGVHTGRVSIGAPSLVSPAPSFHCTWYPRSVSSGTGSPHWRANPAECAPAAMTTTPASIVDPSQATTCARAPAASPLTLAEVTSVTLPLGPFDDEDDDDDDDDDEDDDDDLRLPLPVLISPPLASNPSLMASRSAAGSRTNHPSSNHHAPPRAARSDTLGSSSSTPDASIGSIRRRSGPPEASRRSVAVSLAPRACTSFWRRMYPFLAANACDRVASFGAYLPMGPSMSIPACSHAPLYPSSASWRMLPSAKAVFRTRSGSEAARKPSAHGIILTRCGDGAILRAPRGFTIIPGASAQSPGRWTGMHAYCANVPAFPLEADCLPPTRSPASISVTLNPDL
mmetsp:Transcript_13329/g.56341  ORF Transcript_13329/g.56341 Transcript_13329/m.56341 type:complete len:415 (-) Transcript_13329:157-1401(-)